MDRSEVIRRLEAISGREYVLSRPEDVLVYEQDAFLVIRALPDIVVLPGSTEEVAAVVRVAREAGLPVIARGAGTGLAGGAIPIQGGVVLVLTRLNRVLEIDRRGRLAVVEPGVVNVELSAAAAAHGLFFAPDPGSQTVSTIGGNAANNAGGPHCLAYGVTTNHVLGVEVVLATGEAVWLGGKAVDAPGYDLVGLVVGSEGTLGVITRLIVRLLPRPESVRTLLALFSGIDEASQAVSGIIAAGIVPTAMEMMDAAMMRAVEAAVHAGYPVDAGAVLLIEVEGVEEALDRLIALLTEECRRHGAQEIRTAAREEDRVLLWKGRKSAAGALGRLAPSYYLHDGTVPRTRLPEVMRRVMAIGARYNLPIGNVFHAGDGNLHPVILFDPRRPGEFARVVEAGEEILRACVEAGGTITGEHGVGIEKRDYMSWIFGPEDLAAMARVKQAFDPEKAFNPGKLLPGGPAVAPVEARPHPVPVGGEMWT